MKLPVEMTVNTAETFVAAVEKTRPGSLTLPKQPAAGSLGGEAAMAQALVTWAASDTAKSVEVPSGANPADRDLLSLIALSLPVAVVDGQGREIRPTDAMAEVGQALAALDKPLSAADLPSGPRLGLLCADHIARGHPAALYEPGSGGAPEPSERKFDTLSHLIANRLLQSQAMRSDLLPTVAFCAFELFANTHDHARTGLRGLRADEPVGAAPRVSVRGVVARKHSIEERGVETVSAGSRPFADYLTRALADRRRRAKRWFLEVSVFDSGPGYAARLLNAPLAEITRDEEAAAVRRCFVKHVGSKGRVGRGMGLADTREQIAAAKGFFRLRTGRLSVCAALDGPNLLEDPLVDWRSGASEFTQNPAVVGTLFTLMLPLMEADEVNVQLPF